MAPDRSLAGASVVGFAWGNRARRVGWIGAVLAALAGVPIVDVHGADFPGSAAERRFAPASVAPEASVEERILALDPNHLSAADVRETLSRAAAPRIINLQGSVPIVTMAPFAEFLIAMGYPEERIRRPGDHALSYSSFVDARELAGTLAWYYEHEGMMPVLIGHSQGGMIVVKVLHELAGDFDASVPVWNPIRRTAEARTSIVDPMTGKERPVIGLKVPYAAALATGKLPRLLFGQWSMLSRLREIPDTAREFTGFSLEWDAIAGNFGSVEPYRAMGSAQVRNVVLPSRASHVTLPQAVELARNPVTRDWIDHYAPGTAAAAPQVAIDTSNLLHAADIWYSVKKHWCLEAQRQIRARRGELADHE
jgi:hypothetical protein